VNASQAWTVPSVAVNTASPALTATADSTPPGTFFRHRTFPLSSSTATTSPRAPATAFELRLLLQPTRT
jgi:hypothetical protein